MLGQIHNQRRSAEFAGKSYSRAIAITKAYNEKMDFATEYGFAIVFLLLLRVKPGGLLFAGIQCSSWVWMNSATFQRTPENIWGNEATKGVWNGNNLNRHMAILGKVASQIGVTWLVEQPSSSKFFSTPNMLSCIETCDAKHVHFNMSAFGHVMLKPTVIMGTASWMHEINDPQPGASSSDADAPVLPLKKLKERPAAAKKAHSTLLRWPRSAPCFPVLCCITPISSRQMQTERSA